MPEIVSAALVFGLTAGLKPGPLAVIIIQQTLLHGLRSGLRASLAPLITDGPIILAALFLWSSLPDVDALIAAISALGGAYLLYLAVKTMRTGLPAEPQPSEFGPSLSTAVRVNLLNPYPYLFWFTVGGAYLSAGGRLEAWAFVTVTLGSLVMSKMLLAWLAYHFGGFLRSRAYLWLLRGLGLLLAWFGAALLLKAIDLVVGGDATMALIFRLSMMA